MYYVYALVHPITKLPFYIGKTIDPKNRLKQHIHGKKSLVSKYIRQAMLGYGIEPIMDILHETNSIEDVNLTEMVLINEYGKEHTILNVTNYVPLKKENRVSCVKSVNKNGVIFRCKDWQNCDFCFNERVRSVKERLVTTIDDNGVDFLYSVICTENDTRELRKKYGLKKVIRIPRNGYVNALLAIKDEPNIDYSIINRSEITDQLIIDNYARTPKGARITGGSQTKL